MRYLIKLIMGIDQNYEIKLKLPKVDSVDDNYAENFFCEIMFSDIHLPNALVSEEPEFVTPILSRLPESNNCKIETETQSTKQHNENECTKYFQTTSMRSQEFVIEQANFGNEIKTDRVSKKIDPFLFITGTMLKRSRSPSPIWIPEATPSFAEVVRTGSVSRNNSRCVSPEKLITYRNNEIRDHDITELLNASITKTDEYRNSHEKIDTKKNTSAKIVSSKQRSKTNKNVKTNKQEKKIRKINDNVVKELENVVTTFETFEVIGNKNQNDTLTNVDNIYDDLIKCENKKKISSNEDENYNKLLEIEVCVSNDCENTRWNKTESTISNENTETKNIALETNTEIEAQRKCENVDVCDVTFEDIEKDKKKAHYSTNDRNKLGSKFELESIPTFPDELANVKLDTVKDIIFKLNVDERNEGMNNVEKNVLELDKIKTEVELEQKSCAHLCSVQNTVSKNQRKTKKKEQKITFAEKILGKMENAISSDDSETSVIPQIELNKNDECKNQIFNKCYDSICVEEKQIMKKKKKKKLSKEQNHNNSNITKQEEKCKESTLNVENNAEKLTLHVNQFVKPMKNETIKIDIESVTNEQNSANECISVILDSNINKNEEIESQFSSSEETVSSFKTLSLNEIYNINPEEEGNIKYVKGFVVKYEQVSDNQEKNETKANENKNNEKEIVEEEQNFEKKIDLSDDFSGVEGKIDCRTAKSEFKGVSNVNDKNENDSLTFGTSECKDTYDISIENGGDVETNNAKNMDNKKNESDVKCTYVSEEEESVHYLTESNNVIKEEISLNLENENVSFLFTPGENIRDSQKNYAHTVQTFKKFKKTKSNKKEKVNKSKCQDLIEDSKIKVIKPSKDQLTIEDVLNENLTDSKSTKIFQIESYIPAEVKTKEIIDEKPNQQGCNKFIQPDIEPEKRNANIIKTLTDECIQRKIEVPEEINDAPNVLELKMNIKNSTKHEKQKDNSIISTIYLSKKPAPKTDIGEEITVDDHSKRDLNCNKSTLNEKRETENIKSCVEIARVDQKTKNNNTKKQKNNKKQIQTYKESQQFENDSKILITCENVQRSNSENICNNEEIKCESTELIKSDECLEKIETTKERNNLNSLLEISVESTECTNNKIESPLGHQVLVLDEPNEKILECGVVRVEDTKLVSNELIIKPSIPNKKDKKKSLITLSGELKENIQKPDFRYHVSVPHQTEEKSESNQLTSESNSSFTNSECVTVNSSINTLDANNSYENESSIDVRCNVQTEYNNDNKLEKKSKNTKMKDENFSQNDNGTNEINKNKYFIGLEYKDETLTEIKSSPCSQTSDIKNLMKSNLKKKSIKKSTKNIKHKAVEKCRNESQDFVECAKNSSKMPEKIDERSLHKEHEQQIENQEDATEECISKNIQGAIVDTDKTKVYKLKTKILSPRKKCENSNKSSKNKKNDDIFENEAKHIENVCADTNFAETFTGIVKTNFIEKKRNSNIADQSTLVMCDTIVNKSDDDIKNIAEVKDEIFKSSSSKITEVGLKGDLVEDEKENTKKFEKFNRVKAEFPSKNSYSTENNTNHTSSKRTEICNSSVAEKIRPTNTTPKKKNKKSRKCNNVDDVNSSLNNSKISLNDEDVDGKVEMRNCEIFKVEIQSETDAENICHPFQCNLATTINDKFGIEKPFIDFENSEICLDQKNIQHDAKETKENPEAMKETLCKTTETVSFTEECTKDAQNITDESRNNENTNISDCQIFHLGTPEDTATNIIFDKNYEIVTEISHDNSSNLHKSEEKPVHTIKKTSETIAETQKQIKGTEIETICAEESANTLAQIVQGIILESNVDLFHPDKKKLKKFKSKINLEKNWNEPVTEINDVADTNMIEENSLTTLTFTNDEQQNQYNEKLQKDVEQNPVSFDDIRGLNKNDDVDVERTVEVSSKPDLNVNSFNESNLSDKKKKKRSERQKKLNKVVDYDLFGLQKSKNTKNMQNDVYGSDKLQKDNEKQTNYTENDVRNSKNDIILKSELANENLSNGDPIEQKSFNENLYPTSYNNVNEKIKKKHSKKSKKSKINIYSKADPKVENNQNNDNNVKCVNEKKLKNILNTVNVDTSSKDRNMSVINKKCDQISDVIVFNPSNKVENSCIVLDELYSSADNFSSSEISTILEGLSSTENERKNNEDISDNSNEITALNGKFENSCVNLNQTECSQINNKNELSCEVAENDIILSENNLTDENVVEFPIINNVNLIGVIKDNLMRNVFVKNKIKQQEGKNNTVKPLPKKIKNTLENVGSDDFKKDFKKVSKEKLLDNTVMKDKRDLKKQKVKCGKLTQITKKSYLKDEKVSNAGAAEVDVQANSVVENWLTKQSMITCYDNITAPNENEFISTYEETKSNSVDGISPDSIMLEAQLNGIFGSVMDKHYHKNSVSNKFENAISESLKKDVQNIFAKEKKTKEKHSKNQNTDFSLCQKNSNENRNWNTLESACIVSKEREGSNSEIQSSDYSNVQKLNVESQNSSFSSNIVVHAHSLPHYHVKPSGEVIRKFTHNLEKENSPKESYYTENQNVELWFVKNIDKMSDNFKNTPRSTLCEITEHSSRQYSTESDFIDNEKVFSEQNERFCNIPKNKRFNKKIISSNNVTTGNEDVIDENLLSTQNRKNSIMAESIRKKVEENLSEIHQSVDEMKNQLNSPTDFRNIIENLETNENIVTTIQDQLQQWLETTECETLLSELNDIKANIKNLKLYVLSQQDLQLTKDQVQQKKLSDLYRCSETITSTRNWITTVELKLASDDDRYLDDAIEENNIYKILSKEANLNSLKIQECIQICDWYLVSDEDSNIKNTLDTLTDLQSKIFEVSKLLAERLKALQIKPTSATEISFDISNSQAANETSLPEKQEIYQEDTNINFISAEIQTTPIVVSEKEIQTSLIDENLAVENAEVQTSIIHDSSSLSNDIECSKESLTSEEQSLISNVSIFDKSETFITEISEIQNLHLEPDILDEFTSETICSEIMKKIPSSESESDNLITVPVSFEVHAECKDSLVVNSNALKSSTVIDTEISEVDKFLESNIFHATDASLSELQQREIIKEQILYEISGSEEINIIKSVPCSSQKLEDNIILGEIKRNVENVQSSVVTSLSNVLQKESAEEKPNDSFVKERNQFGSSFVNSSTIGEEKEFFEIANNDLANSQVKKHLITVSDCPFKEQDSVTVEVQFTSSSPSVINNPIQTDSSLCANVSTDTEMTMFSEAIDVIEQDFSKKPDNFLNLEENDSTIEKPAQYLSKLTQCEIHNVDQKIQSCDIVKDDSIILKSNKGTITKNRNSKKKVKHRSDTMSFSVNQAESLSDEKVNIQSIIEEDKFESNQTESITSSSIWENITKKILLRIHGTDLPFTILYLKPYISPADIKSSINNFSNSLSTLDTYLYNKDHEKLKIIIPDYAERISNFLEDTEFHILHQKQFSFCTSLEKQMSMLKNIQEIKIDINEKCLKPLIIVIEKVFTTLPNEEVECCKVVIESLETQYQNMNKIFNLSNDKLNIIYEQWLYYTTQINEIYQAIRILKLNVENIISCSVDFSFEEELSTLAEYENTNREYSSKLAILMSTAEKIIIHLPSYNVPEEVNLICTEIKSIEFIIINEREKIVQIMNEAEEYEQILTVITQIMDAANNILLVFPVSVSSLTHLLDEIQKYRTFFVHLNHWKNMLESVRENLDERILKKYSELHPNVVARASKIIEKGCSHSQQIALAAWKWTLISKGIKEEAEWLRTIQDRFPDLSTVKSTDYLHFHVLYRTLGKDIYQNLARINNLVNSAHELRKVISCSELECGYEKYKETVTILHDNINNSIYMLENFDENWNLYTSNKEKLSQWMDITEADLNYFDPMLNMNTFWVLLAQFEVYTKLNETLCTNFLNSINILTIQDKQEQQEIYDNVQKRWQKLISSMNGIQNKVGEIIINPNVPADQKLSSIEKELNQLDTAFSNIHENIENEEQFQLHFNKIKVMEKSVQRIENELLCYKLLTIVESEKVGRLINKAQLFEMKISEEVENGQITNEYIIEINCRTKKIFREQMRQNSVLDQCESNLNLQEDVIEALHKCENLNNELEIQWHEITTLCEMFHVIPKKLNITITLSCVDQNIVKIKKNQENLETQCKILLNSLKEKANLWQKFTDLIKEVKQSSEEVNFKMDLLSVHSTVDYKRLIPITENLEELSEALENRESNLINELKNAADRLKFVSREEIQDEIDASVDESVVLWNDTRKSLRSLCERYENAVKIWAVYRKNSDIVNEWVDNQLNSLSYLSTEDLLNQLHIYDHAITEQSEKLVELRSMVMEIANEVGVSEDNLLTDEIILLSKKLDDVKSAIITLNNINTDKKCEILIETLEETEKCISSIKEDLQFNIEPKLNQENIEQVQKLQVYLHSLALKDTEISNMKVEQAAILSNPETSVHKEKISITKILESWQQVFKETFQQYHRLFSTIAGNQDCVEALNLWKDYLHSIEEFLKTKIPDNYDNLNCDQQICQLHENLLISQNSVLLNEKTKRNSSYLTDQLNVLSVLHNEILLKIKNRYDEVKRRLDYWQCYRKDQNELLSWLRNIETEQSRLNLRYLYLKTIDTTLHKIEDLLEKIPHGISLADKLQEQHVHLLKDCGSVLCSSVKVELDMVYKRINNLEAALKTWYKFLNKIKSVSSLYEEEVEKIEEIFRKTYEGIESEISSNQTNYAIDDINRKIKIIKNYEEIVTSIDVEFLKLTEFEEKLKEAVDVKDIKAIKQKNWLLKQHQAELKYQLCTYIFQFEEKLALWQHFDNRQNNFLSWSKKINERLDEFSTKMNHPEIVLRRLEFEFCAEVNSKHNEYDWLLKTGSLLLEYESEEHKNKPKNLSEKIGEIRSAWRKINNNTKGEVEKVKRIIKEMENLKVEFKELIKWIKKRRGDFNKSISFQNFENSTLEKKLEEHENVQREIQNKCSHVTQTLECGEVFLMDCENCNISLDIKSFMLDFDTLESSWSSLQIAWTENKERILTVWKLIQEVLSLCNLEIPWLIEQEHEFADLKEKCDIEPFSSLQSIIQKLNVILGAINNHSTQFKLLEESYVELLAKNNIENITIAEETLKRYTKLKWLISELLDSLNVILHNWTEFESYHMNLVLKLSQFDAKLTQLQHLNESPIEHSNKFYEDKLQKLMNLESEFDSLKESTQHADTLKNNLLLNNKSENVNIVQKMVDEYLLMYREIKKRMKTLKKLYKKHLSMKLNVNEEVQVETLKFEKDFAAQVDTLPTSLQRKDAFLFELQNTMKESKDNIEKLKESTASSNNTDETTKTIACCQSSIDLMKHLSAVLETQCNLSPNDFNLIRVKELDSDFQHVLSTIRFQQQQQKIEDDCEFGRLRCPLCSQRNWSQLNNDIWRLEKWLEQADGTLQSNPDSPPKNIEQLQDVIQEHKEFMMYLDSHRDIIVSLNIVGKHLMNHSQNEEQCVVLQDKMARINEKWEKVCSQSLIWQNKLQITLKENVEFRNVIRELLEWIEKIENSIKNYEPVNLTEEESLIQEKYNNFKKLHKELKRYEPRVASLQTANQVCASHQIEQLEDTQNKLDYLRLRLHSLIKLTQLYILKLGAVLGHDVHDMYSSVNLNISRNLSQKFLDGELINEPKDQSDSSQSNISNNDDNNQPVLSRGYRFLGRVIKASLPIQAFIFVILGVISLFPRADEQEYSCNTSNNMAWSFEPQLRYPNGPPPT